MSGYLKNDCLDCIMQLPIFNFTKCACLMWLKIVYDEEDIAAWPVNSNRIVVSLSQEKTVPISSGVDSFRVSPIFPLVVQKAIPNIESVTIYFFNFQNAFRVLGRVDKKGSNNLKKSTYFSTGLSSIILIVDNENLIDEFRRVVSHEEDACEKWIIKNSCIENISYQVNKGKSLHIDEVEIVSYEALDVTARALVDEFRVTIQLLLSKLIFHMASEMPKIRRLIEEINTLVIELVFLCEFEGPVPETLSEYSIDDLRGAKLNSLITHQNLDRIIQVNSSLSYISTQAFSGAIPILERRSLIRRNSLLGIGSGILALNSIARFIEISFSKVPFEDLIIKFMSIASPLKGLENLPQYDCKDWHEGSVNNFDSEIKSEGTYFKLPYFSGRLGFRETEYSIAAAIQSISSGASLQWSLMTLTHEMLHGHVRNIITCIFCGNDNLKPEQQRQSFFEKFSKKLNHVEQSEKLIDSVRAILLTYCVFTITHGSLTHKLHYKSNKFAIVEPSENDLWNIFEKENRNISEIFVHIMDLHYFYASRISIYIPLIWCSWIAVPHINGDLRQYILRSLLTIASQENGSPYERLKLATSRLKELLENHQENKLKFPIIFDVIVILEDEKLLQEYYFPAFKASLMLVDLVSKVFISEKIRGFLFNDDLVQWEDTEMEENSFERKFRYSLPEGFHDELIKSPLSYLLDRMIKELHSKVKIDDLEKETTLQFLALNSNEKN